MRILIFLLMIMSGPVVAGYAQMGPGMMHDTSPVVYERSSFSEQMRISRGGQLYDNWWKTTVDTNKPEQDHPLWKTQDSNKRTGYSTYRCKECHGWDYKGKSGAYGKGSHYTGFTGVYESSKKMRIEELEAVLRGSADKDHDFSKYLDDNDISDLALFLKKGLVDTAGFVNLNKVPVGGGDLVAGGDIFMRNCTHMCHGGSGTMINFGDREEPEFVGTIANENPWEFIHKVRSGQPGTRMPSAIINDWKEKDILDLLVYARTLPAHVPEQGWFGRMMGRMGWGRRHHDWISAPDTRGFGPVRQ